MVIVTNFEAVRELLRKFPQQVQHRVMGAAWREASKPLVRSAQRHLSSKTTPKTGNLYNSIGPVLMPLKSTKEVGETWVGPRRRAGFKGRHGHLVEFGTRPRPAGGWYARFKNPKKTVMPALPFMRPAWNETNQIVLNGMKENIGGKFFSYMVRTLKKAGIKPNI